MPIGPLNFLTSADRRKTKRMEKGRYAWRYRKKIFYPKRSIPLCVYAPHEYFCNNENSYILRDNLFFFSNNNPNFFSWFGVCKSQIFWLTYLYEFTKMKYTLNLLFWNSLKLSDAEIKRPKVVCWVTRLSLQQIKPPRKLSENMFFCFFL